MNLSATATPQRPFRGSKQICLPFNSEAHYQSCVNDLTQYRTHLRTLRFCGAAFGIGYNRRPRLLRRVDTDDFCLSYSFLL